MSRIGTPLRDELALSWRTLLLIGVLAAIGVSAAAPILSLRRPASPTGSALSLEPMGEIGPVVAWTADAAGPSANRAAALAELFPVLAAVAWAALAVAVIAMLGRLVAQSYERGPEIGIRRSVGARRRDILAAQLVEAAIAAAAILAVALPAAAAALALSVDAWPGPVSAAPLDPLLPVAAVAGVLTLGALLPLAHRSARRLVGGDTMPVTLALPAAQIGASLAVLIAGVVMFRHAGTIAARTDSPGSAGGVIVDVESTAGDTTARAAAYEALIARLAADSRYEVASLASRGMHAGLGTVDFDMTDCGFCVRGNIVLRWLDVYSTHHVITPDTFTAAGIPVVAGRGIQPEDRWDAPRVAVVNRHLAARYFERGEAVGRDIYIGTAWPQTPHRVVGVVDDERAPVLGAAAQPRETVYLSAFQHPPATAELVLRDGSGTPLARLEADSIVHASGGTILRVAQPESERARAARHARPVEWFAGWFAAAGAAALLVALFATFDTVQLWVRSVSGELAMRRAAGATRNRITLFTAARATGAVIAGSAAGAAVFATLIWDYLATAIPGLPYWSPATVAACAALMLGAALAAAMRATRRFLGTEPARWLG